MKPRKKGPEWHVVVSFKTELLSEYLIHKGYRDDLPKLLPHIGLLRNRMILDNDICVDLREVAKVKAVLYRNILSQARRAYGLIRNQSKIFLRVAEEVGKRARQNISTTHHLKLSNTFFRAYQATLGCIGIPTIIDLALEERIRKHLAESGIKNIDAAFAALAVSARQVDTVREYLAMLNLAKAYKKKTYTAAARVAIQRHAKQYGWLHSTLFLGNIYDEAQIAEAVKRHSDTARRELYRLRSEKQEQLQEAKRIISKLKHKQWQREAAFLQQAVYFRTARLEWINRGCFLARPLFEEIAKRLRIRYEDLLYMQPPEIDLALRKNILPSINRIRTRQKGYAFISDDTQKLALYVGKRLEQLKTEFHHREAKAYIQGTVACRGHVIGKAVIVKDRSELYKVEDGDILITRLTTPDFIVAMKKARAIVTDLGGLTSHAAIVSRELHIPCIVGVAHATTSFHDGDMVDVDANTGIVKIIK